MPTYEYRCKSCSNELEVQQSFSDDPLETCPECGGDLRKVYGSVGISFKGSGFYKNDARPSSGAKSGSSSASESPSTESPSTSDSSPKSDSPSTSDSSSKSDSGTSTAAASTTSSSSSD